MPKKRLKIYLYFSLLLLCLFSVLPSPCLAQAKFPDGTKYVKARLVTDASSIPFQSTESAGAPLVRIGVHFEIQAGWHIYWKNPGEAAMATRIVWSVPDSLDPPRSPPEYWPTPHHFIERGDITTYGYRDETLIYDYLNWKEGAVRPTEEQLQIEAEVSWLVCKDICVPGRTTLSHTIDVNSDTAIIPSKEQNLFHRFAIPSPPMSAALLPSLSGTLQLSNSVASTAPGKDFVTSVFLPGFKAASSQDAGQRLQVFPHPSNFFTFGRPYVARLSKEAGEPGGALINIPVSVANDAPIRAQDLGLTLALQATSGEEVARDVLGRVEISKESKGKASAHDLEDYTEEFIPLSYRSISQKDEYSTPAAKTQVVSGLAAASLLSAMLSALIGGMLLNLMPCVLPILSLKIMGILSACDQDASEARRSALAYSFGILVSFIAIASIVVAFKSMGLSIGWGFQFQYPAFVAALIFVVFLLALGFFDFYTVQLPGMQSANKVVGNLHPSFAKHFFDGVLATALSTPCTAPFLGAALLVAFSQSTLITYVLFICVGLGLALPYAVFTTSPKLLCFLPKPGAWMCRVRHLMGFILLVTVIWLLFVLHKLTEEGVIWALSGMLAVYFSFWLSDWANSISAKSKQALVKILAFAFCFAVLAYVYPRLVERASDNQADLSSSEGIKWRNYSLELVTELQQNGKAVFIDFTADWCVTCKANEFMVIETPAVAQAIKGNNIVPLKADWTSGDEKITAAIKSYGAEGVPLYVLLPPDADAEPIVFPSLLTSSSLINAFEQVSINRKRSGG